jgi:hypothetical protein
MKQLWRFAAVSLGPGVVLFLSLVGYAVVEVYILGNFDPKFGRFGSIQLTAFISGLMLICSLSGHALACLVFRKVVCHLRGWWLFGVVLALSLGQGALIASMGRLLPDYVIGMMVAWAVVSAFLALAALAAVHRWSPKLR